MLAVSWARGGLILALDTPSSPANRAGCPLALTRTLPSPAAAGQLLQTCFRWETLPATDYLPPTTYCQPPTPENVSGLQLRLPVTRPPGGTWDSLSGQILGNCARAAEGHEFISLSV